MIDPSPWLDALREHAAAARDRCAPEDVHDLRVATRRMCSWLRLGRRKVLRPDLRWLRGVAGRVRDADVVLTMHPGAEWSRWLERVREEHQAALVGALTSERTQGLFIALECAAALPTSVARVNLARLAHRALGASAAIDAMPDDVESFHHLRRAVRSLRYAIEWLDGKTGAFREFQELSGLVADAALALRVLDQFPGAQKLAARRAELEHELGARRAVALAAWPSLRERVVELARD